MSFSAPYISRSYFSVHLGDLVFPEVFLSQSFGEHLVAACARGFKLFSNRRLFFFFPPKEIFHRTLVHKAPQCGMVLAQVG